MGRPGVLAAVVLAIMAAGVFAIQTMAGGTPPEAPAIEILEPWARPAYGGGPDEVRIGAAFMTIKNVGGHDDEIIGARCAEASAARIHRTLHYGPGSEDGAAVSDTSAGDDPGRYGPGDDVVVPAGEAVELKPGGFHIALIGLDDDLAEGDEVTVTLTFREAGEQVVTVPVVRP